MVQSIALQLQCGAIERSRLPLARRGRASLSCRAAAAAATVGKPVGELVKVPAYKGKAALVKKGQFIKIINTHGQQVVDTWCFGTDNAGAGGLLTTFMSMHHSHDAIRKHIPAPGDTLVTSQSKPILTLLEDSGPGIHDTTVAACSHELYESILGIGPGDFHDSCTSNLHAALAEVKMKLTDTPLDYYTPSPFNLWMNVPLRTTAAASFEDWWVGPDPRQKPGDYVLFRAEMNCVVVMSACPSSDISPLNGPTGKSHDVHYQIFGA